MPKRYISSSAVSVFRAMARAQKQLTDKDKRQERRQMTAWVEHCKTCPSCNQRLQMRVLADWSPEVSEKESENMQAVNKGNPFIKGGPPIPGMEGMPNMSFPGLKAIAISLEKAKAMGLLPPDAEDGEVIENEGHGGPKKVKKPYQH